MSAGVGDGRSGLLPRPIAALKREYTGLKPIPSERLYLVPLTGAAQTQAVGRARLDMHRTDNKLCTKSCGGSSVVRLGAYAIQ